MNVFAAYLQFVDGIRGKDAKLHTANILRPVRRTDTFVARAHDILQKIVAIQRYITQNRKDYLGLNKHLPSKTAKMTDSVRDQIDIAVEKEMVPQCTKCIDALKAQLVSSHTDLQPDVLKFQHGILMSLYENLANTHQTFEDMRMTRLKREADSHGGSTIGIKLQDKASSLTSPKQPLPKPRAQNSDDANSRTEPTVLSSPSDDADQIYAAENAELLQECKRLAEVRTVETIAVTLSHVSREFASKIASQAKEIELLHDKAVDANANTQLANQQLETATESGVSSRLSFLTFLLLASFCLLVLHWYE
eukprot:gnl/Hemi2/21416_TR7128_c0_g1_i1.p1 gnl/Hemi2/21416_TR7128_c0_g1~~gnl/Hemi2/21416_TR7128_c0_g1_i1.p1  ORF type:complete len:307 (-),score=52.51 gnl/Hemi2/21416_TR7128_c0_g1_i1:245-1165(-)